MKNNFDIEEFLLIMQEKNIVEAEKITEILKSCGVKYITMKMTEQTMKAEKPVAIPQNYTQNGVINISFDIEKNRVVASGEKNEIFIQEAKSMGFKWVSDKGWVLYECEMNGTLENISAELGNHLLNNGFAVRFETQEILEKAVNGDYEPRCNRWVAYKDGYFILLWTRSEDIYDKAMTLPYAKYDKAIYGVKVPDKYFDAILDFAEQNEFKINSNAKAHIEELKDEKLRVVPKAKKNTKEMIKNVLDSNNKILEDLRDED